MYQRIHARRHGVDKENFYASKRFTSLEMFRETDEYQKTNLLFSMIQKAFPKTTRRFNKPVVFWAKVVDSAVFLVVICLTVARKAVICMDKKITNGLGKKIEFKVI